MTKRFSLYVAPAIYMALGAPLVPVEAQGIPGGAAPPATARTGNGEVGKRQDAAAASINTAPTERISSRIETRVQSRLQTRIDRGYAVASTPTQAVDASLRQLQITARPR